MARRNQKKSPLKAIIVASLFILIPAAIAFGWFYQVQLPVSDSQDITYFVIGKGDTVDQIGKKLVEKNLIKSQPVFKFIVMKEGIATKIQAGSFQLSPSMSVSQIANTLTVGRQDVWVTIIEGMRREEIAQSLQVSFSESGIDFDPDIFLRETIGKEGMLFPDTYLFPLSTTESTVASMLTGTFNKKITDKMKADIASQGKTLNEVLTMASLIEREARVSSSRKMVSGILWNRINADWPLQVDATMQYVKGYSKVLKDWWSPPLAADKKLESPYNTYQSQGLPPGPICSPSINSIMAAIYPTPNKYWFYITDNQGNMHYAATVEQHNQNVQTYLR